MIRRALLALVLAAAAAPVLGAAGPAAAATAPTLGGIATAQQDTFTGQLTVTGWAYDTAHTAVSVYVNLYVNSRYVGRVRADRPSPGLDRYRHIAGRHVFRFATTVHGRAGTVVLTRSGAGGVLSRRAATHFYPGPGARAVIVAKRYVGRARYVDGGASPRGFDCSGYTEYVYAQARIRTLPHNAEAQRHVRGMHRISRSAARPGDLVFYLSGGSAYHVAIYAGHGMQYAAATPRDGIRYQPIWSSQIEFRTVWH